MGHLNLTETPPCLPKAKAITHHGLALTSATALPLTTLATETALDDPYSVVDYFGRLSQATNLSLPPAIAKAAGSRASNNNKPLNAQQVFKLFQYVASLSLSLSHSATVTALRRNALTAALFAGTSRTPGISS